MGIVALRTGPSAGLYVKDPETFGETSKIVNRKSDLHAPQHQSQSRSGRQDLQLDRGRRGILNGYTQEGLEEPPDPDQDRRKTPSTPRQEWK